MSEASLVKHLQKMKDKQVTVTVRHGERIRGALTEVADGFITVQREHKGFIYIRVEAIDMVE